MLTYLPNRPHKVPFSVLVDFLQCPSCLDAKIGREVHVNQKKDVFFGKDLSRLQKEASDIIFYDHRQLSADFSGSKSSVQGL